MNKIKYTNGTLTALDADFYTLQLFNKGVKVYSATLTRFEACKLVSKSNKIVIN